MSSERTFKQKVTTAIIVVSLGPIAMAQRDLRRRPSTEVRGPKLLWRLGSTNAVVAILYLRAGRRAA